MVGRKARAIDDRQVKEHDACMSGTKKGVGREDAVRAYLVACMYSRAKPLES